MATRWLAELITKGGGSGVAVGTQIDNCDYSAKMQVIGRSGTYTNRLK